MIEATPCLFMIGLVIFVGGCIYLGQRLNRASKTTYDTLSTGNGLPYTPPTIHDGGDCRDGCSGGASDAWREKLNTPTINYPRPVAVERRTENDTNRTRREVRPLYLPEPNIGKDQPIEVPNWPVKKRTDA